jgi:hypothetical protein
MVMTIIEYYISTNFMHQVAYLSFLGSYIKKSYVLKQVWDQETFKIDDKICPSEFLTSRQVLKTI